MSWRTLSGRAPASLADRTAMNTPAPTDRQCVSAVRHCNPGSSILRRSNVCSAFSTSIPARKQHCLPKPSAPDPGFWHFQVWEIRWTVLVSQTASARSGFRVLLNFDFCGTPASEKVTFPIRSETPRTKVNRQTFPVRNVVLAILAYGGELSAVAVRLDLCLSPRCLDDAMLMSRRYVVASPCPFDDAKPTMTEDASRVAHSPLAPCATQGAHGATRFVPDVQSMLPSSLSLFVKW